MKRILVATSIMLWTLAPSNAAVVIQGLQVEYRNTPLGIDVAQPRFSWQMATTAGERGYAQTAYQIEVKDPKGALVWDSQRRETVRFPGDQVRRKSAQSRDPVLVDRHRLEPGGRETRREFVVRNRPHGPRAGFERMGWRQVDRGRRMRTWYSTLRISPSSM